MALSEEQALAADDPELAHCEAHGGYDHCALYAWEAWVEGAWVRHAEMGLDDELEREGMMRL